MALNYHLPDGRVLSAGVPFKLQHDEELGEVHYPENWLELATPEDLAERGITTSEVVVPPPPSLDDPSTQAELLDFLADLRWQAEVAGTMWDQVPLPTDRERRSALKDAADKLRDGTLTFPIAVAFSASVYANVDLAQLDAAIGVITVYVQEVFSDAATVAAAIIAGTYTTKAQVLAAWEAARAS